MAGKLSQSLELAEGGEEVTHPYPRSKWMRDLLKDSFANAVIDYVCNQGEVPDGSKAERRMLKRNGKAYARDVVDDLFNSQAKRITRS